MQRCGGNRGPSRQGAEPLDVTTVGQDYLGEQGVRVGSCPCRLEDEMPDKLDHVSRCPQGTLKEPVPCWSKGWSDT